MTLTARRLALAPSVLGGSAMLVASAPGCSSSSGGASGGADSSAADVSSGTDSGESEAAADSGGDGGIEGAADAGAGDSGAADGGPFDSGGDAADHPDATPSCAVGLDPTFGTAGLVQVTTPTVLQEYSPHGFAVQPDGKILVTGYTVYQTQNVIVARFNADGSLDASFGTGGTATVTVSGLGYGTSLALQPDGKIVVGGVTEPSFTWFLARLDTTGALDTTFGTAGFATPPSTGARVDAVVVRASGAIVVVGDSVQTGPIYTAQIAQFSATGVLDPTWGTAGVTATRLGSTSIPAAAALQPDGQLLVSASTTTKTDAGNVSAVVLARFRTDGTLDPAFGVAGVAQTSAGGFVSASTIALQSSGAIVLTGGTSGAFSAVRFTSAGQLDTSFGSGGVAQTSVLGPQDYSLALALLPGDAFVLAGQGRTTTDAGSLVELALARFTASGTLDTSFGTGGTLLTSIAGQTSNALRGAALTPTGQLVVAGNGMVPTSDGGATTVLDVARYACP